MLLKAIWVVPMKLVPVMVTGVPTGPLVGVKPVTLGSKVTIKLATLVSAPALLVTLIRPVEAPAGTIA